MRYVIVAGFWLALLALACDDDTAGVQPTPTLPTRLVGSYDGVVTYWLYAGTDSVETDSAEIRFAFEADNSFSYLLPNSGVCNFGFGLFQYEQGRVSLHNLTIWPSPFPVTCPDGPLNVIAGNFRVYETDGGLMFEQGEEGAGMQRNIRLTPSAPTSDAYLR